MKAILLLLLCLIVFAACKREEANPINQTPSLVAYSADSCNSIITRFLKIPIDTTNIVKIQGLPTNLTWDIKLFNRWGQVVGNTVIYPNPPEIQFSVDSLSSGPYWILGSSNLCSWNSRFYVFH